MDLNDPRFEFLRDDRVFQIEEYEDRVDPRLPWSLAGAREPDRLAGALRQLADLVSGRHDLPMPEDSYARLDVIAGDGRHVAEITQGLGGYRFRVLSGAFEQATEPPDASKVAAADTPAAQRPAGRGSHPDHAPPSRPKRQLAAGGSRRRP